MRFPMPRLPYDYSALEPWISQSTIQLHYEGHLQGYIDKLNRMPEVANSPRRSLEEFIIEGKGQSHRDVMNVIPPGYHPSPMYNQAAQIYNHVFYFRSMTPGGGGPPVGDFKQICDSQYGSWENFRRYIITRGKSLFGSGWVWVCLDDEGQLLIVKGLNAELPIVYRNLSPILCIDVWEHAYYLDYGNDRGKYLEAVSGNLINWDFANRNLREA